MDAPWKPYAKWQKPGIEDYALYDPIYVKCPGQANLQGQKVG